MSLLQVIADRRARGKLPLLETDGIYRISERAIVEEGAKIGFGTTIWHDVQIRGGAKIGDDCMIGKGAYIGTEVELGDRCKIQNYACIYGPSKIGDGVFIGPHVVFANDKHPRAVEPDRTVRTKAGWRAKGVTIEEGASIGAGAVILGGVTIERWAMVAAGAVVTKRVLIHELVAGTPARRIGTVCRCGVKLKGLRLSCPECAKGGA